MGTTAETGILAVGAVCGAIGGMLALAGVVWRILLPWIRTQIIEPVQATKDQVSNTHHTNLRDDLTEVILAIQSLATKVDRVEEKADRTERKVGRIGRQLDVHLTTAATVDASTNARLTTLEKGAT